MAMAGRFTSLISPFFASGNLRRLSVISEHTAKWMQLSGMLPSDLRYTVIFRVDFKHLSGTAFEWNMNALSSVKGMKIKTQHRQLTKNPQWSSLMKFLQLRWKGGLWHVKEIEILHLAIPLSSYVWTRPSQMYANIVAFGMSKVITIEENNVSYAAYKEVLQHDSLSTFVLVTIFWVARTLLMLIFEAIFLRKF